MSNHPVIIGAERQRLVDGMVGVFDSVVSGHCGPIWISLEAPSGFGKTRIVQEFYSRLAATRQISPTYWPSSLLIDDPGAGSSDQTSSLALRRATTKVGKMDRASQALPSWCWLGLNTTSRGGSSSATLGIDLLELEAHKELLLIRALTSNRRRAAAHIGKKVQKFTKEEAASAAETLCQNALASVIPGVGAIWSIGKWLTGEAKAANKARATFNNAGVIDPDTQSADIVDDTVQTILALASPSLPFIIAVEDVHNADDLLVELIQRLISSNASIIVVTTSWPGMLDERMPATLLDELGDRIIRLDHRSGPQRTGPLSTYGLMELTHADLELIVAESLPQSSQVSRKAIAARWDNPLAIRLTCLHRDVVKQCASEIDTDFLDLLPNQLEDIYRDMWERLDDSAREAISLPTCAIPSQIGESAVGTDSFWDAELIQHAAAAILADEPDLLRDLPSAGTLHDWVHPVNERLRKFPNPIQQSIAKSKGPRYEARKILENMVAAAGMSLDDNRLDDTTAIHRCHLIFALQEKGVVINPAALGAAALSLTTRLDPYRRERGRIIQALETAITAQPEGPTNVDLLNELSEVLGYQLRMAGRTKEAIAIQQRVLAAFNSDDSGSEYRDALDSLATSYWDDGQPTQALPLVDAVIAHATNALGEDDAYTLEARLDRARVLSDLRRWDDAAQAFEQILERLSDLPDAFDSLRRATESSYARHHSWRGHPEDAIPILERLAIQSETEELDTHLFAQYDLAVALSQAGRTSESLKIKRELATTFEDSFGSTDFNTISNLSEIGESLQFDGQFDEAVVVLKDALGRCDHLDPNESVVRLIRARLGFALSSAGQHDDGAQMLLDLLAVERRALSPNDPDLMMTMNNTAAALDRAGRLEEAHALYSELALILEAALDPDDVGRRTFESNFRSLKEKIAAKQATRPLR